MINEKRNFTLLLVTPQSLFHVLEELPKSLIFDATAHRTSIHDKNRDSLISVHSIEVFSLSSVLDITLERKKQLCII